MPSELIKEIMICFEFMNIYTSTKPPHNSPSRPIQFHFNRIVMFIQYEYLLPGNFSHQKAEKKKNKKRI